MNWISEAEKKMMAELQAKHERILLGIDPMPQSEPMDNRKWAWIEVNGERQMAWVDNKTMKAYEADGYERTDNEIPQYKFERWCRLMDL